MNLFSLCLVLWITTLQIMVYTVKTIVILYYLIMKFFHNKTNLKQFAYVSYGQVCGEVCFKVKKYSEVRSCGLWWHVIHFLLYFREGHLAIVLSLLRTFRFSFAYSLLEWWNAEVQNLQTKGLRSKNPAVLVLFCLELSVFSEEVYRSWN